MSNIVWLASYPKSGNTWLRIFLANLTSNQESPVDINNLSISKLASNKRWIDLEASIDTGLQSVSEILQTRHKVYEHISQPCTFVKIHDAFQHIGSDPFIPKHNTKAIIYLIRNPLDIAISFANHNHVSIDQCINQMNDSNYTLASNKKKGHVQTPQLLSSWSNHVKSWKQLKDWPILFIKYEDMKLNTEVTFKKIVDFVGLNYNSRQIARALELSSFETLKKQENENGFREKNPSSTSFFRRGIIGDWKQELNENQISKILERHEQVMNEFEYFTQKTMTL